MLVLKLAHVSNSGKPADSAVLRQRLLRLKQAGINILRLPGNMPYECNDFYEMCDEFGILIMQDFAFANFDYLKITPNLSRVLSVKPLNF